MGDSTGISWTNATWNPVRGCSRVSEGCRNCYAERVAARFSGPGMPYEGLATMKSREVKIGATLTKQPDGTINSRSKFKTVSDARWTGEVRMVPEHLADPLKWKRPRRIFVNSMSDLFHESLSNEQIAAVFGVMAASWWHTHQVLTKRMRRAREWFAWLRGPGEDTFTMQQRGIASAPNTTRALLDAAYEYLGKARKPELDKAWHSAAAEADVWPLPNVHLGVSVENQEAADERIPELLRTPASVRFLSCEPLLGEVRLDSIGCGWSALRKCDRGWGTPDERNRVDWVICGAESGPGARPAKQPWFESLRDQCSAAGVPFFLKQMVVDGKLRKERQEFPAGLQIMEFPK